MLIARLRAVFLAIQIAFMMMDLMHPELWKVLESYWRPFSEFRFPGFTLQAAAAKPYSWPFTVLPWQTNQIESISLPHMQNTAVSEMRASGLNVTTGLR